MYLYWGQFQLLPSWFDIVTINMFTLFTRFFCCDNYNLHTPLGFIGVIGLINHLSGVGDTVMGQMVEYMNMLLKRLERL